MVSYDGRSSSFGLLADPDALGDLDAVARARSDDALADAHGRRRAP